MLVFSATLQQTVVDASSISLSDDSLQAFAVILQELGSLMSTLVQNGQQVWLAELPLFETCQRTLQTVQLEPGELFDLAALQMVERVGLAIQTRQQI